MAGLELKKPPAGVTLNGVSARVFELLARYTSFPWPILMAQCKRCSLDPAALTPEGLARVVPFLVEGLTRFTSQDKGALFQQELSLLLGSLTP
jgi:hypothetical protein